MLKLDLKEVERSKNIVDLIKQDPNGNEYLSHIAQQISEGFKVDEDSRVDWKKIIDAIMKLVSVDTETKTTPWPGAANIKYPLIKDAAVNYASRTLPEIIQNDRLVKCVVTGNDPDDQKLQRANRVETYMSYQLLQDESEWEYSLSKLLQILPILGTVFKKTYYSDLDKKPCSELCLPDKIVVNYSCRSMEAARRVTHVISMCTNDIIERQRAGVYDPEIDVDTLHPDPTNNDARDSDYLIDILEQHFWYDLDGDGYKEPYIALVHKDSNQILRIVNRFKEVQYSKKKEILRIVPIQCFTDFHFICSFDGGFYSEGFGSLLFSLNDGINSILNQLVDAGTLNNIQGGFISRDIRLKNGNFNFTQGEWKVLETALGTDLKKSIFPMPTKEPSQTLFSLLSLLIQAGKELSQMTDALEGNQPAQNVSNNVMNNLIEQGSKIFTAINKRLFGQLRKEFKKLYELNAEYVDAEHYMMVLDDPQADYKKDFDLKTMDIYPVADPTVSSTTQRLLKSQVLMSLRTADLRAIDEYTVQSIQLDAAQIKKLLPPIDPKNPPPPPIDTQLKQSEIQLNSVKSQQIQLQTTMDMHKTQLSQQDMQNKTQDANTRTMESQARVAKMGADKAHGDAKITIAANKMVSEQQHKQLNTAHDITMDKNNLGVDVMAQESKNRKIELDSQLKAADIAAKLKIADIDKSK